MTETERPIIIDIGCDNFRLGWAGEDFPEYIEPSIYVDIKDSIVQSENIKGLEDIFVKEEKVNRYKYGNDALNYQNILNVHEFKKENNLSIFWQYFHYFYEKLDIESEHKYKQPLIIISPFFMTDLEKEQMKKIFFKGFKFPKLQFLSESQAIISSLQKSTGLIINLGESNSFISSIFHGFSNIMARDLFPISGQDLTKYFLNKIITERGKSSDKSFYIDKWIAKNLKEEVSLCVVNPEAEIEKIEKDKKDYDQIIQFPDASELLINKIRFLISEPLFDPSLVHVDYMGLPEAIATIVKNWDRENWEELLSNIIIAGGSSLIPGLKERIKLELTDYFSEMLQEKIKVIAPKGRENMAWIGASILSSQGKLTEGWMENPSGVNQQ
ncbi:MAG: hypothetical protein R6U96_14295 [Promethearchaeia archaeon]